jgi:hypothetical protein
MNTYAFKVYCYKVVKVNKHSSIYECIDTPLSEWATKEVKIEKFQQFSNAYNLGEYYRLKNESSWAKSKAPTGLWATETQNVFYGDTGKANKTLLMFKFLDNRDTLQVYVFSSGYYPSKPVIEQTAKTL